MVIVLHKLSYGVSFEVSSHASFYLHGVREAKPNNIGLELS